MQGLCYEVTQRSLLFKTLPEDAMMAPGKSIIVHHQTITIETHRYFQLGLVGGDTHQTEFFTSFVAAELPLGRAVLLFHAPPLAPP